jgi:hypothetical protein
VVELELRDHHQALLDGELLHLLALGETAADLSCGQHGITTLASFLLPEKCNLVRKEYVEG